MAEPLTDRLRTIGYQKARRILVVVGLAVLLVVALVMYVRRVDTVEVTATLLFVPIFLAFLFFRAPGGLIAGVGAALAYLLLRLPAIDAVGFDEFAGLVLSRSFAYVVFGLLGGWSAQTLEGSLDKLDLYDRIDDETGLHNARFFLQDTDFELARAQRYQTLFSIAVVEVPTAALAGLGRRRQRSVLRELGRQLAESVRTVDRVVHAHDDEVHLFAVILPETARNGARIFSGRFAESIGAFLAGRGAVVDDAGLRDTALTLPGDDADLERLRGRFAALDELEHGEPAVPADRAPR